MGIVYIYAAVNLMHPLLVAFSLRMHIQATEYLEHAEYDTGNLNEDLKTQSLMKQLLFNSKLRAACPLPFDEAKLWKGQKGPEVKQQIQNQFRNIRLLILGHTQFPLMKCYASSNSLLLCHAVH